MVIREAGSKIAATMVERGKGTYKMGGGGVISSG